MLYLNQAQDPPIERLLAPRAALACAEHLAFDHGMQVLVVIADITHYCEALREIAAAREEVPGPPRLSGLHVHRSGVDLRARRRAARRAPGSVTQLAMLTMPDDDITHPIPDLTGYITEGQLVLSRDLHLRGVFPPIDVLPSLSRLMNAGIGAGRTVPEHRRWADQLYAVYARGREARMMVAIVGEAGLAPADRRALQLRRRLRARVRASGRVQAARSPKPSRAAGACSTACRRRICCAWAARCWRHANRCARPQPAQERRDDRDQRG